MVAPPAAQLQVEPEPELPAPASVQPTPELVTDYSFLDEGTSDT